MRLSSIVRTLQPLFRVGREISLDEIKGFAQHFSEGSFKDKLFAVAGILSSNTLLPILRVYYVLRSSHISTFQRVLLMGALGYFICPLDFLPDFLPAMIGFADDLAVVSFVLGKVDDYLTPELEARALRRYRSIVGHRIASGAKYRKTW